MKKSFLMLGILGSICAADAFAVRSASTSSLSAQSLGIYKSCPKGCHYVAAESTVANYEEGACYDDQTGAYCGKVEYIIVENAAANSNLETGIDAQLKKQEKTIKNPEMTRAATTTRVATRVNQSVSALSSQDTACTYYQCPQGCTFAPEESTGDITWCKCSGDTYKKARCIVER